MPIILLASFYDGAVNFKTKKKKIFNGGYLGSRTEEERSELR